MSDDFAPRNEVPRRLRPFAEFLIALRFLTRLPVPFVRTLDPPALSEAMRMFPLAGALVGVVTGGSLVLSNLAGLPQFFSAALALAIAALVTGGLHEDGLADVADGFGGGQSRDQRLEIMRDSRIGAYGALALGLTVLARASLYVALLELPLWDTIILIGGAAAFSRALIVDLLWATRPARSNGLSVAAGRPSRNTALFALTFGGLMAGVGAGVVLSPESGVGALIAGGVMLAVIRNLAMRKIGGQTGDVCGTAQVLCELAMLATYAATIG